MRAISAFGAPARDNFVSGAPPIGAPRRAEPLAVAGLGVVKVEALDVAGLGPRARRRHSLGWGGLASVALHGGFVMAALLWSQSRTERAPEPIAVEIVVERAPEPAPAVETPAPTPEATPSAEAVVDPPPAPEPTPSPAAVETAPLIAEAPAPTAEPLPTPVAETSPKPAPSPETVVEPPPPPPPTPVAVAKPPVVAETPTPPPIAKAEPPKPAPSPPPKKIDRSPRIAAKAKPAASHEAAASPSAQPRASAPASSASVGEYRDAVYARLRSRQHFPEAARESGAHGTAELTFSLDGSGQLRSVSLLKSSGDADLDADALGAVRRSAPFPPPPPGAPREFPVKLHYALQ